MLHFTSTAGRQAQTDVAAGLAKDARTAAALAATEAYESLVDDAINAKIEEMTVRSELNGGAATRRAEAVRADQEGMPAQSSSLRKSSYARPRALTIVNDDEQAPQERSSSPLEISVSSKMKMTVTLAESGLPDLTQPNTVQSLALRMGGGIVSSDEAADFADVLATAGKKDQRPTLHVRGVGLADGALEQPGKLEALFGQYGEVAQVVVRHREDADTGENTSWALVYMADEESLNTALMGTTLHPETGCVHRGLHVPPH